MKKIILSSVALCLFIASAYSQTKYDIKISLKNEFIQTYKSSQSTDISYKYKRNKDMKMGLKNVNIYTYQFVPLQNGNFQVTLKTIESESTFGDEIEGKKSGSTTEKEEKKLNKDQQYNRALINVPFIYEINPNGKISQTPDLTEAYNIFTSACGKKAMSQNNFAQLFYKTLLTSIYPPQSVAIGDSWMNALDKVDYILANKQRQCSIKSVSKYTLKEVTDQFYIIEGSTSVKMNALFVTVPMTITNTFFIDKSTGLIDHVIGTGKTSYNKMGFLFNLVSSSNMTTLK